MIVLHEKFEVDRPRHEAFAYVSDFSTAHEWDSTTRSSVKITPGPVAVGSRFALKCDLPVGHINIEYTVTRLEPNELMELSGRCKLFDVTDVIQFTDTATGCHIDYRASFEYRPMLKKLEPGMQSGMEAMARKTIRGMREALEDDYPTPAPAAGTRRADQWVLPGVALFSSAGYRRGRRHWNPMSAWMGDKHVVITGASSGLGYATAMELARAGARLTLVIRNEQRATELVDDLRRETGNEHVHVELADLSLMAEVESLVDRLVQRGDPVDVLINNAGALFNEWGETPEGIEQSFALLTLSPYRLTLGLKPLLLAAPAPRVINVVSGGMYTQKLELKKLQAREQNYSGSVAYARAKRALMVLTEQWAEEWADEGIVLNAMHPGWADTPGVQAALPGFRKVTRTILRDSLEGADTIIWLARATEAGKVSGELFLDREPRPTHLLESTRDDPAEREGLQDYLAAVRPREDAGEAASAA